MRDSIRVVIIGSGKAGYRHAVAASRIAEVELLGCYDISAKASNALADQCGIESFSDLQAALNPNETDLAIICTPPSSHGRIALQAIESGLNVLVEKPFDTSLEMIQKVEHAAEQKGLIAAAVAQHRFSNGARELYRQIEQHPFSHPQRAHLSVQRHRPLEYFQTSTENWRQKQSLSGGGVLLTIGFHYLDLACWILGEPHSARASNFEKYEEIELAISGNFSLGRTYCTFDARWGAVSTLKDCLKIYTEEGTLELIGDQLVNSDINDTADRYDLHARQLKDLVHALKTGSRPFVSPGDVAPALRLISDLYQSIDQEKELNLCRMTGE